MQTTYIIADLVLSRKDGATTFLCEGSETTTSVNGAQKIARKSDATRRVKQWEKMMGYGSPSGVVEIRSIIQPPNLDGVKRKIANLLARGEFALSEIRIGESREATIAALAEMQAAGEIESLCMGTRGGLGYRSVAPSVQIKITAQSERMTNLGLRKGAVFSATKRADGRFDTVSMDGGISFTFTTNEVEEI